MSRVKKNQIKKRHETVTKIKTLKIDINVFLEEIERNVILKIFNLQIYLMD